MNITLIALGSRGDVQPYVALGKGLRDAGHAVCVLTGTEFAGLVTDYDLAFADAGGGTEAAAQEMHALVERGQMLKILARMGKAAQGQSQRATASGLAASHEADLIIAGMGGLFVGVALAEKLGIPFLPAYVVPFTPTRAFPGLLMPRLPLPASANRTTHRLTQQMLWQPFRAADTEARTRVLQTAPAPFRGPFAALERQGSATLYGYSPLVVPRPDDWNASIHVTGYWFLPPPAAWEPPPDLVAFLADGPPPIYIGFGSMASSNPKETAALALDALARTGQRGVLSSGWGGLKPAKLPENVHMVGSVPHTWLFPQMAVVVHHGGAGTTAAGLRAGVPAVVTPFFGDQPFWGGRVSTLGVGPHPIPRRRLTVENLAGAIDRAVSDATMRKRAAALGERIRAEDGIARAVAVIAQAGKQQ